MEPRRGGDTAWYRRLDRGDAGQSRCDAYDGPPTTLRPGDSVFLTDRVSAGPTIAFYFSQFRWAGLVFGRRPACFAGFQEQPERPRLVGGTTDEVWP